MERRPPVTPSDEIDLYVRTYTSLLRSTVEVRVRAFEEAHAFAGSSLHPGALSPTPDVSAFAYAAARLPDDMPGIDLVVLGQSHELFEAAGFEVQSWRTVRTRGRRRPLRLDPEGHRLAVFIASESDIDDFIPILTAFQIEWNKMHERLRPLAADMGADKAAPATEEVARYLGISVDEVDVLTQAFGGRLAQGIANIANHPVDVNVRLLAASYSQYQRSAQRWWSGIEPHYVRSEPPRRRPVYFVSSNTHAIANLVGGYARTHQDAILAFGRETNPEGLAETIAAAQASGNEEDRLPFLYYLLRGYIHARPGRDRMREVRAFEASCGLTHLSEPGHIDVDAQIIEVGKINPSVIDPRLNLPGLAAALPKSDAVIINIDYPLGMAAYHLMSRVGQGVGELHGLYVMGKAATLNGRVGDVALSGTVFDEHSRNTFLFRNAFGAKDIRPYLRYGSVFDNQSALTVRSAFLQNRNYMSAFYRDGYTVLEMEAGPFLAAVYELVHPTRVPQDEIINLSATVPIDVGFVHYASDTPYSRRQSLLSKSLSYFGVDSTYACAIAIVRRILSLEIERTADS
ncbi:hypothetical protein LZC95_08475 [Pendulispora brunnea]|uniref:Uncharacterized protein n=1 Tax=Pendulispora brunnea TaxID=2905690 RepID=A0ABZ2KDW4_9BACT